MNAKIRSVAFALALLSSAGMSSLACAADAKTPSAEEIAAALAAAGQPSDHHAKLKPLAGEWTYTCKVWMDPSQPAVQSKGTVERKWILGGRFLEEHYSGTSPHGSGDFEGRGRIGYDNAQGKYTYDWVCSMSTGSSSGLGTINDKNNQFTFQTEMFCPIFKKTMRGRDEIRIEKDGQVVMESFMNQDGKEMKLMELTAVRKKK